MMFSQKLINYIFKYQLIILVGIFVILAGIWTYALVFQINYQPSQSIKSQKLSAPAPLPGAQRMNGEAIQAGEENLWPIAVSIDNHPDARPTFGLSKAKVVYEFLTEGGSTRFLAFHTPGLAENNKVEKIGPVRSVRPYFLPIVKEYDALLAHAGGSPEALAQIEKMKINNLEEIAWWGPEYFWRVYSRSAPHNLFTESEKLITATEGWKLKDLIPSYRPWLFSQDLNNNYKLNLAEKITLNFSADKNYQVTWQYSTSTANYVRSQNEGVYLDGLNNEPVRADDVIIQFIKEEQVLDDVGRLAMEMTGQGELWLFRDGVKIEGQWRKGSAEGRTIFYDQAGEELPLKPGKIWIEVVPLGKTIDVE